MTTGLYLENQQGVIPVVKRKIAQPGHTQFADVSLHGTLIVQGDEEDADVEFFGQRALVVFEKTLQNALAPPRAVHADWSIDKGPIPVNGF